MNWGQISIIINHAQVECRTCLYADISEFLSENQINLNRLWFVKLIVDYVKMFNSLFDFCKKSLVLYITTYTLDAWNNVDYL